MYGVNYSDYTDFCPEDIPLFASMVFAERTISEDTKHDFVEKFLNRYMTDQKFRDSTQELHIFFVNRVLWKYLGTTREDAGIPDEVPGYNVLGILVTDNPENNYLMNLNQTNVSINTIERPPLPRADLKIYMPDGKTMYENRLVDTGASYTTIPGQEYWDYDLDKYKYENVGSRCNDINLAILNDNIQGVFTVNINGSNGNVIFKKVLWKYPLMISIGDILPVFVREMIVPMVKTSNLNLIGFDVISKHTVILSTVNGVATMKFHPGEQMEIDEQIRQLKIARENEDMKNSFIGKTKAVFSFFPIEEIINEEDIN